MNISELINEILLEWAYRVDDGMPNPKDANHLRQLSNVLDEMGLSHIKNVLVENLLTEKGKTPTDIEEADGGQFSNPILNKSIKYKNNKGEDKEGIVGNLLRLPKDNPGRVAAEKMLPADGTPEREKVNQDLGGQGQPSKPDEPKDKGKEDAGGGEEDKAKAAQAMFDPKADPAMAVRLDKEKEVQAQLAKDAEADKKAEKAQEPKKDNEFQPIDTKDVAKEMPQADPDTFSGSSDIPDAIDPKELEQFNTDINKVAQQVADAKAKGEPAPNINLCDVTVPGTNLYCDDNLGIPRDEMPQFKGNASPGSRAAGMEADASGEVDTEPVFREMLAQKGIKTLQTEVPADKLKATQKDLVGAKVVGMMGALEKDPNHPKITAPIYVSRDGYVIDGHHRWAAIVAHNAKNPDNQIPMKTTVLDMDIKDAIPMANKFAEDMGIAAKKADANKETPSNEPATRDAVPTDEQANEQIVKEKEGLSHEENQVYEFLDGISDTDKAEAIDKALNDRTLIQKAMQDTMVGNWLVKKGKMLKNVYKGIEQKYKTGDSGTTQDCSGAPSGPHAKNKEAIKEAPQNRQDYLASLGKDGKKKKDNTDKSKCKDVHIEDYQKRDENGDLKYKKVPVYESGEKPDPADFGVDGAYYGGLGTGYIGPRQSGTEYGNVSKKDAFKASELDSKTGYFKRDGKYYDKDGEEINEKGQKLDAQGNTTQKTERCFLCWPPGKKVPSTQEVADLEDNLTPEQKHVAHHAEHTAHERHHAMQHLALEAGLIVGGALAGPVILAKLGIGGAAAAHGTAQVAGHAAAEAGGHGAAAFAGHVLKDFGKHALAETLGVSNAYGAAGAGMAASVVSGGILESFWNEIEGYDLLLEDVGDKMDEASSKDFFERLCRLGMEKMKTYKMTPQQKLESIRSYKFEKAQKEKEKQKKDKLKDLASVLKEQISESKEQSIQNFVEYVTKRLKLKEQPKINLISDKKFSTELASLGGYNPELKEIFVATEGRLTADILRTIAHEMVHRKQEEMGLLKHIEVDGADGSPIENQANSIAGILMREYGKLNKQIYNESHTENKKEEPKMKEEHIDLANELMLEMIYGFINEAKPTQDDPDVTYTPIGKNGKPGKPTTIKYSSAIKYDEKHPAYIAALKLKDKKGSAQDTQTTPGAGLFDPEYQKKRGGAAPTSTGKKSNTKVNYDDRVDGETSSKVEQTYNTDTKFSEPGMTHEDRVKHLNKMKSTEINSVKVDDVYTAMGVENGATKFPAKYMSVLTNALNFAKGKFTITDLTDAAGAGTLDSTLGELTTLMGATIQDPAQRKEFFDYLREQVKNGGNKSALTIAWINSAQDSCEAFHRKLKKDCPGGHEVKTNFWDIPSEAKAAGVKNYKKDKGKSTDINTMVDCIAKDGTRTQKWLQPSLKKNKKVNGFNSTTGRVFATTVLRWASPQVKAQYSALGNELDSYEGLDDNAPAGEYTITDKKGNVRPMAIKERKSQLNRMMREIEKDFEDKIPPEANPTLAGERQAELHQKMENDKKVVAERNKFLTDYLAMKPAERKKVCAQIAKDLNQKGDKYAMELMETLDTLAEYDLTTTENFDSALTDMGITNKKDRRKLNVALMGGVISTSGNKTKSAEWKKTITKNSHDHSKAVLEYLISDNDNKKALLENISTQFPLKDLMEGKEWAILGEKGGGINLDRDTITKCLGADNFDDVVEKLVIVDYNGEPTLAYAADNGKRTIPIGVLNCRPDGIMYGSTWKLELSIHEGFADCCKSHDK